MKYQRPTREQHEELAAQLKRLHDESERMWSQVAKHYPRPVLNKARLVHKAFYSLWSQLEDEAIREGHSGMSIYDFDKTYIS